LSRNHRRDILTYCRCKGSRDTALGESSERFEQSLVR
jgi:hypothetical protein